jgi:hypothetical protein
MNDAGTLPRHMLDIRELTAEAFAPYGQIIAPLRTGGQGAETGYDPETSPSEAKLVLAMASRGCGSCICRMSGSASPGSRGTGA